MSFQNLAGNVLGGGQEIAKAAIGAAQGVLGFSPGSQQNDLEVRGMEENHYMVQMRRELESVPEILRNQKDDSVASSLPKPEAGVQYIQWAKDKLGIQMNVDIANSTMLVVVTVSGKSSGCIPGPTGTETSIRGLSIDFNLEQFSGSCFLHRKGGNREIWAYLNLTVDGKEITEEHKLYAW